MPFFKKKPVIVEARCWDGTLSSFNDIAEWSNGKITLNGCLYVQTLEGVITASKNDWIICGVNGEFYPCKPDIFGKTYELVQDK